MKTNLKELAQKEKWAKLGAVAGRARLMQEEVRRNAPDLAIIPPLNHFIKIIYNLQNSELKTFNAWKAAGFMVKKGEKGFIFFSAPRVTTKKVETVSGESFESSNERFFTCHLFATSQVEPIQLKQ